MYVCMYLHYFVCWSVILTQVYAGDTYKVYPGVVSGSFDRANPFHLAACIFISPFSHSEDLVTPSGPGIRDKHSIHPHLSVCGSPLLHLFPPCPPFCCPHIVSCKICEDFCLGSGREQTSWFGHTTRTYFYSNKHVVIQVYYLTRVSESLWRVSKLLQ